ncbi:MAG: hypothetical protein ACTSXU_04505 [Promethearchaeota archaeon]
MSKRSNFNRVDGDYGTYQIRIIKDVKIERIKKEFIEAINSSINYSTTEDQKIFLYSLDEKEHVNSICQYLLESKCKVIFIEKCYVDRDYLMDFSTYHLQAFPHYKKTCLRLHFFRDNSILVSDNFSKGFLLERDVDSIENSLNDVYLGFCVLKPLPRKIIGRTCLLPYSDDGYQFFAFNNKAHLFGIDLSVRSLPFQEQDPSIGRCASVSLWSSIQGCSKLFSNIFTPNVSKITSIAEEYTPTTNRTYPASGLKGSQMVHVLKNVGLEAEYFGDQSVFFQKSIGGLLYAYCRFNIPSILLLAFWKGQKPRISQGKNRPQPDHAVVVSGYKITNNRKTKYDPRRPNLNFNEITQIVIHDDNHGPYIKCNLVNDKNRAGTYYLEIPIFKKAGDFKKADICGIIIPVYKKIRINYELVSRNLFGLDQIVKFYLEENTGNVIEVHWDIFLTDVSTFKKEIRRDDVLNEILKKKILVDCYPRYIWRCSCFKKNMDRHEKIFEVLFDATDLIDASYISKIFFYKDEIRKPLLEYIIAREDYFKKIFKPNEPIDHIEILKRKLAS